ncbi:MAG: hypothetical protein AB7O47_13205 [Flavobacteriales bacterium]
METLVEEIKISKSDINEISKDESDDVLKSFAPLDTQFNFVKVDYNESKITEKLSSESEVDISHNIFKNRDVILNEKWDDVQSIQGKIVHYTKDFVYVDCLRNVNERLFEHREFPIHLFQNLHSLTKGTPVIIKSSIKKGSFRIDIYDGKGMVNLELFKLNEKLDLLTQSGLDTPLTEW